MLCFSRDRGRLSAALLVLHLLIYKDILCNSALKEEKNMSGSGIELKPFKLYGSERERKGKGGHQGNLKRREESL